MAYARKPREGGMSLKSSRTPISAYRYAVTTQNTVFVVIIAAIVAVLAAIIIAFAMAPSRLVPMAAENLVADYYENIFYDTMLNSDSYSGNPEKALSKYSMAGLSTVTLQDISLLSEKDADAEYLARYCELDETTARIFPEEPYGRHDYRVEYNYSCNY